MKLTKILTTFTFIFLFMALLKPVTAQQTDTSSFSVKLTPNNNSIAVNPGDTETLNLYIQNLSKTDIVAWIYTRDFTSSDNKGDVKIYSDSNTNSGTESWITFNNIYAQSQIYDDAYGNIQFQQVTPSTAHGSGYIPLTPNQQFTLSYVIQVPKTAYFGTHNTIIFVQPIINSPDSFNSSIIEGRVGSNLLIDLGQHTKGNLSIKNIDLKQSSVFSIPSLSIDVKNNGDYVNFTKSTLAISDLFSSKKINLDPITVLSHSDRLINYKGNSDIKLDSITNIYFLKYDVKIQVTDTSTGQILTKSISFIYINPLIAVSVLILIIIIFIIIKRLRYR